MTERFSKRVRELRSLGLGGLQRGLLVSQFPEGSAPNRSHFPRRNKTMALLSHATMVVEAGEKSGTRYQGREALRLGRALLFPRKFLEATSAKWPAELVKRGALAFDARTLPLVLDDLPNRNAGPSEQGLLPL